MIAIRFCERARHIHTNLCKLKCPKVKPGIFYTFQPDLPRHSHVEDLEKQVTNAVKALLGILIVNGE